MEELLKSLTPSELVLIVLVLGWFIKNSYEEKQKRSGDLESTVALLKTSVTELTVKVEYLNQYLAILPKLKADIDAAHDKLREYEPRKSQS